MNFSEWKYIPTLTLVLANFLLSWIGFRDEKFVEKFCFYKSRIVENREYYRLVSSLFIHADLIHLLLNCFTLLFIGFALGETFHLLSIPILFLGSGIISNLLLTFLAYPEDDEFMPIGASAGVTGLLMGSVVLYPDLKIQIINTPLYIQVWIYGIFFLIITHLILNDSRKSTITGAFFYGGLTGLILSLLIHPILFWNNIEIFLFCSGCFLLAIYFHFNLFFKSIVYPHNKFINTISRKSLDDYKPRGKQELVNKLERILEKISAFGLESLTKEERKELDQISELL